MSKTNEKESKVDSRVKQGWDTYPGGKKPKLIGLVKKVYDKLDKQSAAYKRDLQNHIEFLLERFANGSATVQDPISGEWITIKTRPKRTKGTKGTKRAKPAAAPIAPADAAEQSSTAA